MTNTDEQLRDAILHSIGETPLVSSLRVGQVVYLYITPHTGPVGFIEFYRPDDWMIMPLDKLDKVTKCVTGIVMSEPFMYTRYGFGPEQSRIVYLENLPLKPYPESAIHPEPKGSIVF
jgi:hypothetical protein